MLSYGRVVGQLSRIKRHAHHNNFSEPLKRLDFVSISCLRYSSKSKKTRTTGTTAKVEECVPKTKPFKDVPPLPPPPLPPTPHAASASPILSVSTQDTKPPERKQPPCEDRTYSCPPCYEEPCFKPGGGGGGKDPGFKYWKHVIAALILTGVSVIAYIEWFMGGDEDVKKEKKVPKSVSRQVIKEPESSHEIPAEVQYLLLGGGTAAFSAFRAIKSRDPTAKVLVITNEGELPYMRPPLSKELWYNKDEALTSKLIFRQWNGTKRRLLYEPPQFYLKCDQLLDAENGGIAVAKGWNVKRIDVPEKTAYLDDDDEYAIKYEKCLIATGASPKNLPVFETADEKVKEKIIPFRTKDDYLELVKNMKNPAVKDIVIIGGGFLGSELSTSIVRNLEDDGQNVFQIYKEQFVMAQILPEYLSAWTTKRLQCLGVNCMPNLEVHDVRMKNKKLQLTLTDGQILEADQVIVAIGVEANTQFAEVSNLEVDPEQGGFLVNAELEARSNLWVAGDAACFYDVKLGRRRIEHHDHAVVSGRLAGENMTGAGKPYLHQSMFWSDLGPEVGFEAIGIVDSSLETVGVFAKATEEDTPLAAVGFSDDSVRSESEEKQLSKDETKIQPVSVPQASPESVSQSSRSEKKIEFAKAVSNETSNNAACEAEAQQDYGKGVIFYLRDNVVVGIVLWNIFNRMSIARRLLARGTKYDELNEAAKLFSIHDD